ncbi:Ig-like domain-containing protein [Georgenia sp.]
MVEDTRATPSIRTTAVGIPTPWGTPTLVGATLTSTSAPTGAVRILDDGQQVGTATLVRLGSRTSVAARLLWLTGRGQHTLTVVYEGDADNRGVTSREMTVRVR